MWQIFLLRTFIFLFTLKACPNGKIFDDQTPLNSVWWPNILPFGHLVWCCLLLFDRVWSCLIKFEGHQTFDQATKNISFVLVFDGRCFVRLDSRIKHVWCTHAYHAFSAAFIHTYRVLPTYVACSVLLNWRTKKKLWWTLLKMGR